MYLSIPETLYVPIYYVEDILFTRKLEYLDEHNTDSHFVNLVRHRKEIVVGVSLPNQRIQRWIRDKNFFESCALQKGVTLKLEDADYNPNLQAEQVENLISQGVDVLIIAPLDSLASSDLVKKATDAGIKVISYDGLIYNSDLDLYISFNNAQIGELQGRYLIQNVPKGNYIILSGDPNEDTAKLYKNGAMLYIKPLANTGSIKIISDKAIPNWNPKEAYSIVKNVLTSNNRVNAILSPTDDIAGGAIKALEEVGLAGKVAVTGQDATPKAIKRILEGTQSMTVLKDTRQLAKAAIDSAVNLVNGESLDTNAIVNYDSIDIPAIILAPTLVNRYNIPETILNTGYLKPTDIYN